MSTDCHRRIERFLSILLQVSRAARGEALNKEQRGATLSGSGAARVPAVLEQLGDLYRAHIAVEEGDVFPAAAKSLTAREREAMGGEMAACRGLSRIG